MPKRHRAFRPIPLRIRPAMREAAGHLLQGRRNSVSITRAGGKQARYAAHVLTLAVCVSGTDFDVSQTRAIRSQPEGACATVVTRNEEEKSLRHVDPILRLCCARSPANNRSIATHLFCAQGRHGQIRRQGFQSCFLVNVWQFWQGAITRYQTFAAFAAAGAASGLSGCPRMSA